MRSALARRLVAGLGTALMLGACEEAVGPWEPAEAEFRDFQRVYPVLMRDCGFHTCHGSTERFFRIYGPGRARLDEDTLAFDPLTGDEASASFLSALSFIDAQRPEQSPLLKKPLSVAAGGAGHEGVDPFGRNVYRTREDSGYRAIEAWVLGTNAADGGVAITEESLP